MASEVPDAKFRRDGKRSFLLAPGTPLGTAGLRLDPDGRPYGTGRSVSAEGPDRDHRVPLTPAQAGAFASVAKSGSREAVDLDLPGLGPYRVLPAAGRSLVLGFPLPEADRTVRTLIAVEVCVSLAGVIAASLAGQALVGVALRPLHRVAATATRVSELTLDSGEPALHERVSEAEADPRTEVGEVGAALNRLLGHVSSALMARQQSEARSGSSSPTPVTSCARRWLPSAATRN